MHSQSVHGLTPATFSLQRGVRKRRTSIRWWGVMRAVLRYMLSRCQGLESFIVRPVLRAATVAYIKARHAGEGRIHRPREKRRFESTRRLRFVCTDIISIVYTSIRCLSDVSANGGAVIGYRWVAILCCSWYTDLRDWHFGWRQMDRLPRDILCSSRTDAPVRKKSTLFIFVGNVFSAQINRASYFEVLWPG